MITKLYGIIHLFGGLHLYRDEECKVPYQGAFSLYDDRPDTVTIHLPDGRLKDVPLIMADEKAEA